MFGIYIYNTSGFSPLSIRFPLCSRRLLIAENQLNKQKYDTIFSGKRVISLCLESRKLGKCTVNCVQSVLFEIGGQTYVNYLLTKIDKVIKSVSFLS